VRQGKLRYVGLSNHPAWQLTQALWIADDRRLQAPVCAQVKYSLIDRAAERELVPACVQFGLSIVPSMPRLTSWCLGKYAHSVSSSFPRRWRLGLAITEVVLAAGLIVAAVTEGGWYWWAGAIAAAALALVNLSVYLGTERERRRPRDP
jgi:aryl-alcohol dehydrogenase-like predicted oxidoreductase